MTVEQIKNIIKGKKTNSARKYYYYKPKESTIINSYSNGQIYEHEVDGDCLYINHFRMLVDQKIDYLMSKPIISSIDSSPIFGEELQSILEEAELHASLDSVVWLHLFVNDQARLDWMFVFDNEIIEIKDSRNKNTIGIIRFYNISEDIIKVELWNDKGVKYLEINDKDIVKDIEGSHYEKVLEYSENEIINKTPASFGFIPFIPLYSNKSHENDAVVIESLIKAYNNITNGFIENIEEYQDALLLLKGFIGDSEEIKKTMKGLKKTKGIGLPSDGNVDYLKVEIPVEARSVILDLLEKAIYSLGRGLNSNQVGDGNITNVVIKSRYIPLDLKANDTEKQIKLFYKKLVNCINSYYNSNYNHDITFNRVQLINESEKIKDCVESVGILSKETIRKNHPWNTDDDLEQKRIESEKEIVDIDEQQEQPTSTMQ